MADGFGLGRAELIIRAATEDDFEGLIDLDASSARHHVGLDPDFYRLPDREAIAAFLRRRLADPDREVLVAIADGAIIAMVDVTIAEDPDPGSVVRPVPTADLGVSVLEAWRGRGIGQALMAAAEASARVRGAKRVVLDASARNLDAIRLYERLGYATGGVFMRKELE
jgi:ribosomal protein S18 acetylase RimI-like enzyme